MVELIVMAPFEVGLGYNRTVVITILPLFKESENLFCTERRLLVFTGPVSADMHASDKRMRVQNNFICLYKGLEKRRTPHLSCRTAVWRITTIQSPSKAND